MAFHILVLCTGNSARSILGEALVNAHGRPRICGYSAGSKPVGVINPGAVEVLHSHGHATDALSSKSWDVFASDGPNLDMVITVCDNAAGEACPVFLGAPLRVHWGLPDPAALSGQARADRFLKVYEALDGSIQALVQAIQAGECGETLKKTAEALAPGDIR